MAANHNPPVEDAVNPKLAETIKNLPEDRQLDLLKHLLKGGIITALFESIRKMSAEEQLDLLQQLEEPPIISPSQEETEIALRRHSRKSCMINADYTVEGRNFEGFMLDISRTGVFIETDEAFTAGQQIQLVFSLPNIRRTNNRFRRNSMEG